MKQAQAAPAVVYLLFFIVGFCLQMAAGCPLYLLFLILILVCAAAGLLGGKYYWLLILCVIGSGMLRYETAVQEHICTENSNIDSDSLTADVLSRKAGPFFITSYLLRVSDGRHTVRARLTSRLTTPVLIPGRRYTVNGAVLESIDPPVNPFVFDYHRYCRQKGISHSLKPGKYSVFREGRVVFPLRRAAHRLSEDVSCRFLCVLGIEKGSLVNGMLLGRKSEIPVYLSDMFRDLGISHLLAVSGLHVGLIVLVVMQCLALLPLGVRGRPLVLLMFLIFYCFITGGTPSVVRSSLMTGILLLSPLFSRSYDPLNAVAVSALILLLVNPFYIQDVGFQYSYAAVCGILLLYGRLSELKADRKRNAAFQYVLDILLVSVCASLFTAPISLLYFGTLPLLALFLNILVIPLTFCLMVTALLSLPALYFHSFIGDCFLNCLDMILEIFRGLLRLASRSALWTAHIAVPLRPCFLAALGVILCVLILRKSYLKICLASVCAAAGLMVMCCSRSPEVVDLTLKNGSCLLLNDGHETLVVNTGRSTYFSNDYERAIRPVLAHWGSDTLQCVMTEPGNKGRANFNRLKSDHPVSRLYSLYPLDDWEYPFQISAKDLKLTCGRLHLQIKEDRFFICAPGSDTLGILPENRMILGSDTLNSGRVILRRGRWRKKG